MSGSEPRPQDYAEWIVAYLERTLTGTGYGQCRLAVQEMTGVFPELRQVYGCVIDRSWGRRSHWWCVAPNGAIVDPTAAQFPELLDYVEWRPGDAVRIGKCGYCGKEIFAAVQSLSALPARKYVCDDECGAVYAKYIDEDGARLRAAVCESVVPERSDDGEQPL